MARTGRVREKRFDLLLCGSRVVRHLQLALGYTHLGQTLNNLVVQRAVRLRDFDGLNLAGL